MPASTCLVFLQLFGIFGPSAPGTPDDNVRLLTSQGWIQTLRVGISEQSSTVYFKQALHELNILSYCLLNYAFLR